MKTLLDISSAGKVLPASPLPLFISSAALLNLCTETGCRLHEQMNKRHYSIKNNENVLLFEDTLRTITTNQKSFIFFSDKDKN